MIEHRQNMINKIMSKITINNIPLIEGDPDYEVINVNMQLQYDNVATLTTPQIGVNYGHNDEAEDIHNPHNNSVENPTRSRSIPHNTYKRHHGPTRTTQTSTRQSRENILGYRHNG